MEDVLHLAPEEMNRSWSEIDKIIWQLSSPQAQLEAWSEVLEHLCDAGVSKGHPCFRIGVLHLWLDSSEAEGIKYLERAFNEDKQYAPREGKIPQRLAAYRLLCLLKGFLEHVRKSGNWQAKQLDGTARPVLFHTLLTVYDQSRQHYLDMPAHTFQSFFTLISNRQLSAFAIENYFTAENIFELLITKGSRIISPAIGEYALARVTIGLLGGVLEAILCDRLAATNNPTLGGLIKEAVDRRVIQVGTRLGVLSSMILYFRNHIHARRQADRAEYLIDVSVAKSTKVMLDWAMNEMLADNAKAQAATT